MGRLPDRKISAAVSRLRARTKKNPALQTARKHSLKSTLSPPNPAGEVKPPSTALREMNRDETQEIQSIDRLPYASEGATHKCNAEGYEDVHD